MDNKYLRGASISDPTKKIFDIPDAPTIGTATDVGTSRAYNNGAATVTVTADATTGGPSQGHLITSTPGSYTATDTKPLLSGTATYTVTGLQSGTAYTFSAKTTNSSGNSQSSTFTSAITATTVPQAPTIGTAADGGTGTTATVAFTAGATGGQSITGYSVVSNPTTTTQSASVSPYTFTGLTAGTAYTFQVAAVNANGTSAYSSASNSVTPVVPSNFFLISTVAGSGTSITFSSIPNTYKAIQIRGISRDINGNANTGGIQLNFNSDTGSNYWSHRLGGLNSTVSAGSTPSAATLIQTFSSEPYNGLLANVFGATIIDIVDYANTSKNKTVKMINGTNVNTTDSNSGVYLQSALWLSTSAINSITLTTNASGFATGSTFSLYGVS